MRAQRLELSSIFSQAYSALHLFRSVLSYFVSNLLFFFFTLFLFVPFQFNQSFIVWRAPTSYGCMHAKCWLEREKKLPEAKARITLNF